MSDLSPLSAVKRKSDLRNVRAAVELKADVSEAGSDVCLWGGKADMASKRQHFRFCPKRTSIINQRFVHARESG
jgi:hypothetical protein